MSMKKESAWVQYVREHFEPIENTYEQEMLLLALLNAPEEYGVEEKMLAHAKIKQNATMQELYEYFKQIA